MFDTRSAAGRFGPPSKQQAWRTATDDLDRKIIEMLQGDGRASHAKMARVLEVSEGTVRRRLSSCSKTGIIRVVAIASQSNSATTRPRSSGSR